MTPRPTLLLAVLLLGSTCATSALADPKATIQGVEDTDLRRALERAIGESDSAATSRFEARRRARGAMETAEALLRSEGYYQSSITDEVRGDSPPVALLTINPGQRFMLTGSSISWRETPPDDDTITRALEAMRARPDAGSDSASDEPRPGRAVDVIAAEGRIVASLSRNGYADARAEPRRVVVDHATFTVQPEYRINSGDLVRLNGLLVRSRGNTDHAWVASLAPWQEGDRYDPEQVAELERRLIDTGVYNTVNVALSPPDEITPEGLRPIIVGLQDRPARVRDVGASWSTAEGIGAEVLWSFHNRRGRGDILRAEARVADIDSRLGADLSLPHWRKPGRTLRLGAALVNEDTDAYVRSAATFYAELQQRIGKTSWFNYGFGVDAGHYKENRFDFTTVPPRAVTFDRNIAILTGRSSAYFDYSNDPLNPTKGWRVAASVQPTAVVGESSVVFLRAEGQATGYLPLQRDGSTVLAGRAKLGSIIGGTELNVPADRLFYSGGGGSVRGYQYQGVNPELPDNTPRGGVSLFETSIELRRDVFRNIQGVAFVEGGAVGFQETPNFTNMRYAAGVGVRYMLPFGPIRADVALPLNKREGDPGFQVYISIGQAF